MHDLTTTVNTLQKIRDAQQRFLGLWALDCLIDQRAILRKISADIAGQQPRPGRKMRKNSWLPPKLNGRFKF